MIANNPVHEVCDYGSQALYSELPTPEQVRAGVIPLDSLPAAWWNAMWNDTNKAVNEARGAIGVMVNELCNVLVGAGICPSCSCLDQLYQSIDKLRQTLATATVAGAVKSSPNCGEVSVDGTTGIMTANGLGNAAQLATSARTTVGAINELKQIYDCCISDINACTGTLGTGKAPTMHAAAATDYGVGNATCYGHVRLSDTFDTVLADCSGVAASQYALATAYQCLIACSGAPLGNTVGCALGTANAGYASTAARSDHVHPLPTCMCNSYIAASTCCYLQCIALNSQNLCLRAYCRSGTVYACHTIEVASNGVTFTSAGGSTCGGGGSSSSRITGCTFHGNVCGTACIARIACCICGGFGPFSICYATVSTAANAFACIASGCAAVVLYPWSNMYGHMGSTCIVIGNKTSRSLVADVVLLMECNYGSGDVYLTSCCVTIPVNSCIAWQYFGGIRIRAASGVGLTACLV